LISTIRASEKSGAKLLGAGGGGFIFSLNSQELPSENSKPTPQINLNSFVPKIDHLGARVISTF
jgi:galactokinase/mevalonate kinase-like predicted kinase